MGPGPNYFSAHPDNARVDEDGRLHLTVRKKNDRWLCSEVIALQPLGYGRYIFYVGSRVDEFDPNIVAGLFTWDSSRKEDNYSEVDIEFSRWGEPEGTNGQYVVQPSHRSENLYRFLFRQEGTKTTHVIHWEEDLIEFASFHGHIGESLIRDPEFRDEARTIAEWRYENGKVPAINDAVVRLNLYLSKGADPLDPSLEQAEILFDSFVFIPNKEK
jgi:hypothetical protein